MIILQKRSTNLDWILSSLHFLKKHILLVLLLGLAAGLGRAAQLRAFGEIAPWLDTILEITIQTARIWIFLFALGLTSVKKGLLRFLKIFSPKNNDLKNWQVAWMTLKTQWPAIILNLSVFLVMALLMNLLIDHIAYETCLYITLQKDGLISGNTSEWSLILFFKNISVIPFTLVFNATLLLWFVNRLPQQVRKA